MLDASLDRLDGYWRGGFQPQPVQSPRIPVWVAGNWPNRKPIRRALRWDGLFPIDLPGPGALAELVDEIRQVRSGQFDFVVEVPPGADTRPWEEAGATWVLTGIEPQPPESEIRQIIQAGP
jgi:hypothetical protein